MKEILDRVELQVVDQIVSFLAQSQQQDDLLIPCVNNMNHSFDELFDRESIKNKAIFDFETLSKKSRRLHSAKFRRGGVETGNQGPEEESILR